MQTLSAQLSWSHCLLLLGTAYDSKQWQWYIAQTVAQGWSVRQLESAIDNQSYERQALSSKASNFDERLAPPQRGLARDLLKDPYIFDFIDYPQVSVGCAR